MATTTLPPRKTVLSLLAHPDDAEFLCAGTLIRLAEAGWEVHIASATAGDLGTNTQSRWEISARRTKEAENAAAVMGASYHCLGEHDQFVVYDKPTLRKTIDLFRRVAPTLVFTHALADYMMDHEMVAQLARSGSFVYAGRNASSFPLIEGSQIPYLYYCDPVEGIDPLGRAVEPTTVIDISSQMDRKTEMLACHESQREWLREHHGMDEYLESMRRLAAQRGELISGAYGEAFVQHRGHAYPRGDLLAELFP